MEHTTESDEKKRPYHSRVRQRQAEETRQRILEAARSLFESQGYAATTLEAIAELAEVAQITRQAYEPMASSLELLRTAGAVAPELADVARQIEARRRQNQARLIASLSEQGALRPGLSFEEATDVLWALTNYDVYRMLVVERSWKPERYETWLAQLLIQQMLEPGGE